MPESAAKLRTKMKIKITHTVDIDPKKWAAEYGIDISEVRKDAACYFFNLCQEQVERLGMKGKPKQAAQIRLLDGHKAPKLSPASEP